MKSISEQVQDLENTRGSRVGRMEEVAKKAMEAGRSMDASEQEEFDTIKDEIKQLDGDITRYRELETLLLGKAAPVEHTVQVRTVEKTIHAPTVITNKSDPDDKFPGQSFTRLCIAKALAREDSTTPAVIAERMWGKSHPKLVDVIKADVGGHGSGSSEAGAELINYNRYLGDFVDYLYGQTVYNKLNLREVPENINIGIQDGAATAYWVGESKPIPVTVADYNSVNLSPLKVAAISVCSKEWLRNASPSGEMLTRDAIVNAAAQRIDTTFISASAEVAGSTPAGILYNIPGTTSAGTDGDGVANDFKEMMYRFTAAKNSGGEIVIIMNPALATGLSLMRNALDQYEFPTLSRNGGTIFGMPVITGDNVNASYVVMLKPSDIWRIGLGNLQVSMTDTASIEMANNPANASDAPTAATGKVVSMFQTESVAFKVVQSINFQRRRESAVAWINNANYGGSIST